MHKFLEKIEVLVDRIIPYALVLLIILIVVEFTIDTKPYEVIFGIIDESILVLFIVDLIFKYHRVKTTMEFFKKYWLEIIAAFPFYLIIRVYAEVVELSRGVEEAQKILHGTTLIKEGRLLEESRNLKIFEEEVRLAKEARFFRTLRVAQRTLRFFAAKIWLTKEMLLHHSRNIWQTKEVYLHKADSKKHKKK